MIRFTGTGRRPAIAPRGDAWGEVGDAVATSLGAVPEATSLPPATLVYVLEPQGRWPGLLSAFGKQSVPRHTRCAALLHAGYVDIEATVDRASHLDIVVGRVP